MAYAVWLQGVGRSMLVKWWSKHYTVIYYLYIAVDFYWWLLHPGLSNVSVQSGLDNGRTAHCVWHRLSQDSLINEFNNNLIGIIQHDCFVFVSSVQFAGEPPPNVTFCVRGGKGENGKSMALVIIELFTAGLELGRTNAALSLVHSITETTIALLVIFIRTANGLVGYKEIRSTIRLQQDLDPDSADIHGHRVQTPAGLGSRLRRHPRPPRSSTPDLLRRRRCSAVHRRFGVFLRLLPPISSRLDRLDEQFLPGHNTSPVVHLYNNGRCHCRQNSRRSVQGLRLFPFHFGWP